MFSRFEKAFDGSALASQLHKIGSRIRIGGRDKSQFSFAIDPFEPEPGHRKRIVYALEIHLQTALVMTVEVFEAATVFERTIASQTDNRSPRTVANRIEKLKSAKLGIGLHEYDSTIQQGLGHGRQQLTP